jgi:glycosyltransferase involved in cell wall biosynthesis
MTPPRVVVDAGNVVRGGGIQVASSFLDEICRLRLEAEPGRTWPWLATAELRVSPEVLANMRHPDARRTVVVDQRTRPWSRKRPVAPADVVFEVFGPVYRSVPARRRITGFADATSLFPEYAAVEGPCSRTRLALRRRLSRWTFSRADTLVCESASIRDSLAERWGWPVERVHVVPNVLNGAFTAPDIERDLPALDRIPRDRATFCYVTRAYPHKNLDVLGAAGDVLRTRHGVDVRFVVTLTDQELSQLSPSTRRQAVNLGPLEISHVPAVYRRCTGTVFTSLLECFSATPLEAMALGSPLVASDRGFVRDVAGDAARYVEPTSPDSVASGLLDVLQDERGRERRRNVGLVRIGGWPDAQDRTYEYLRIIADALD